MTEQDLINSLEFKIIKKTLKLEYPWIKDIIPDGDPDMYKFTIYINVIFDPFELSKIFNIPPANWVRRFLLDDGKIEHLSCLSTFFNIKIREQILNIKDEIKRTIKSIHSSRVINQSLKLDREILISGFSVYTDQLSEESLSELHNPTSPEI
jgi:hypothetical protein